MQANGSNRTARLLAVAALISSAVASIVLLVMPSIQTGGIIAPTTIGTKITPVPTFTTQVVWFGFVQDQGVRILIYLAIPILICVAGVLAMRLKDRGSGGIILWPLGILLFALDFMAMMSIGIYFFPAAVLLLAAAYTNSQESTAS